MPKFSPAFSFWVSFIPIKGDRICSGSSANLWSFEAVEFYFQTFKPSSTSPSVILIVMSSPSVEVLLKLNQLLELHKLYFNGMADSFTLVGIQHRIIMLLLQSVEQCLDCFEQLLRVEQGLEHPQQESHGVGTQVPSGTGPGSIPASSRHCSLFGRGVQGVHIVIGEASSGGTGVIPGSPPGDVSCSFY